MRYCILFLIFGVVSTEGNRRSEYDTLLRQALGHLGGKDVQQLETYVEINPTQSDFDIKVESAEDGNQSGDSTEEKNLTPYDVEESQDIKEESNSQNGQSSIRGRNKFDSEDQPLLLLTSSGELVLVPEDVQVPINRQAFYANAFRNSLFGIDDYQREEVRSKIPSVEKLIEDLVQKINEVAPTINVGESLQKFLMPGFCESTVPVVAETSLDSSIKTPLPDKIPIDALPDKISEGAPTPDTVSPLRTKPSPPTLEVDSQLMKLLAEYYSKKKQNENYQQSQHLYKEILQMKQLLQQRAISPEGFLNNLPGIGSDTGRPTMNVVPISYLQGLINGDQVLINQLLRASELRELANVPPGLMIGIGNPQNQFVLPEGMELVSIIENRPLPISIFELTGGFPSSFVRTDNEEDSNKATIQTQEQPTATIDELLEVIESLRLHSSIEKKLEKYFTIENRNDLNGADRYKLIQYIESLEKENESLALENTRRHFEERNLKTELRNLNLSRRIAGELSEALSRRYGQKGFSRKRPNISLFQGSKINNANNRQMRDFDINMAYEKLQEIESEKRTRDPRLDTGNVKIAGFENFMTSKIYIKRKIFNPALIEILLDFRPLSLQPVGVEEGTPAVAEFLLQLKFDLLTQSLITPYTNLMAFNVKMVTPEDVMLPACSKLSETKLQGYLDEIVEALNASDLQIVLGSILSNLLNSGSNPDLRQELSELITPGFHFP